MVTNALFATQLTLEQEPDADPRHAERISLTLRLLPGRIVIEVFDNNPVPPVLRSAGAESEGGRGLMLVDALSKEWGYFITPQGGKVVFTVVEAESPPMTHVRDCQVPRHSPDITELPQEEK
jgi:hypothetical protein